MNEQEPRNPITNLTEEETKAVLDRARAIRSASDIERRKRTAPHLVAQTRKRAFEMAEKALRNLRRVKQTEEVKEKSFRLEQLIFDMRLGNR